MELNTSRTKSEDECFERLQHPAYAGSQQIYRDKKGDVSSNQLHGIGVEV